MNAGGDGCAAWDGLGQGLSPPLTHWQPERPLAWDGTVRPPPRRAMFSVWDPLAVRGILPPAMLLATQRPAGPVYHGAFRISVSAYRDRYPCLASARAGAFNLKFSAQGHSTSLQA